MQILLGSTSVLLPHEVFHSLYKHAPELFRHLFVDTEENLEYFWSETSRTHAEFENNHPCKNVSPRKRIPVGMHGDDAGTYESEKAWD